MEEEARGRLVEKEGAGARGKERKRGSGAPERVAAKRARKGANKRERKRERRERVGARARNGNRGGQGDGRERFLLRPASKMALAAAPLVIKINN